MTGPQWAGGEPSFTFTLTPKEIQAVITETLTAAMAGADSNRCIKLALALEWLTWALGPRKDQTMTKDKRLEFLTAEELATEDGRLAAAEAAGRAVAQFQIRNGHTTPQDWTRDDNPYAGAYSHLAAAGFTRLGARMYALPFIRAYKNEFPDTENTEG